MLSLIGGLVIAGACYVIGRNRDTLVVKYSWLGWLPDWTIAP